MHHNDSHARETDHLAAGYQALADAAWEAGLAQFKAAVRAEESAEAHEGLAMAAWWLDDVATIFASRERAYRLYRQRDDQRGAARVAIWIALDHYIYRDEPAIADGWLQRARRLLAGQLPSVEHGWLAIWSGHIALTDHNDVDAARRLGAAALALGRSLGNADLEALALALEGLAMVSAGDVDEGMRRLDESTTAAVSGDVGDYDAIATICCYLIFACERVRDYDRAAQWCAKVEEVSLGCDYRSMFPVCRTHYASVMIWRGERQQAEAELSEAIRRLNASRRGWATDSIVRLAELRRRQGRADEAATLFSNVMHWNVDYLPRQRAVLPATSGGLARKAKPLVRVAERETAAYAVLSGIEYEVEECPMAAGNTLNRYKEWLNRLEEDSPGLKAQFLLGFLERGADLFEETTPPELSRCSECGRPTTGDTCAFCRLGAATRVKIASRRGSAGD